MTTHTSLRTSSHTSEPYFDITKLHSFMLKESLFNKESVSETNRRLFLKPVRSNVHSSTPKEKGTKIIFSSPESIVSPPEITPKAMIKTSINPRERDSLFWCFYMMKNDVEMYEYMPNRNVVLEKSLKIEYINKFRENKTIIKASRLAPISHIENALLNEHAIDMRTFQALCVLEGLSCVFTFGNCYYEINTDQEEDDISNIHRIMRISENGEREKYGYLLESVPDNIVMVRNSKFKVENLSKPIKAMTAYKMDELQDMCKKLNIETEPKSKKKDMYEKIVQALL